MNPICPACGGESAKFKLKKNSVDQLSNFDCISQAKKCGNCQAVWLPRLAKKAGLGFLGLGILVICFGTALAWLSVLAFSWITFASLVGGIVITITGSLLISHSLNIVSGAFKEATVLGVYDPKGKSLDRSKADDSGRIARNRVKIISGYVHGLLSVLFLPPVLGLAAILTGVVNIRSGRKNHGVAQIILGITCAVIGLMLGI